MSMTWNKIITAAALGATALLLPHARAAEPVTTPTTESEEDRRQRLDEAERPKLEAASEAEPATRPASPTPAPVAFVPPSRQSLILPASYYAVTSRSIFIKGSQEVFDNYGRYAGGGPSRTPAAVSSWASTQQSSARMETTLVFDGATHADGRFTALMEDASTHNITKVSPGDRLARGTVTGLTLDQLDYTANGRTVHVQVGQDLDGNASSIGGAATGSGDSGASSSSSPPSTPAPLSGTGGDLLEQMKRRRLQELNGK